VVKTQEGIVRNNHWFVLAWLAEGERGKELMR
jgi:hypothetical protein